MNLMGKRIASVALAGTLIASGLAGCGGQKQEQPAEEQQQATEQTQQAEAKEPTTTAELLEAYKKNADINNCHADMDLGITLSSSGENLVSVTTKGSFDAIGDEAHGTMTVTGAGASTTAESEYDETYGETTTTAAQPTTVEMYITKEGTNYVTYSTSDNGTTWTSSTAATNSSPAASLADETILSGGQFAKTTSGYTLTVTGDKIMGALANTGMTNNITGLDASITNELANSTAVYTFDTDCRLVGCDFNVAINSGTNASTATNTTVTTGEEAALDSVPMTLKMDIKLTLSNYGSVTAAQVQVPAQVKQVAIASTTGDALGTTTSTTKKTVAYSEYDEYGNLIEYDEDGNIITDSTTGTGTATGTGTGTATGTGTTTGTTTGAGTGTTTGTGTATDTTTGTATGTTAGTTTGTTTGAATTDGTTGTTTGTTTTNAGV